MTSNENCAHTDESGPVFESGVGFYPEFHALWHLNALRVIDDATSFISGLWNQAAKNDPVRIVVMDTTVDWEHPNLMGVIDLENMRDFASANIAEPVACKVQPEGSSAEKFVTRETSPTIYGGHGTAVAGLIGARPAEVNLQLPDRVEPYGTTPRSNGHRKIVLPYAGINPFCKIIPVSLTAAPDPDMVLAALKHIQTLDTQIIVVAAAWDDADRAKKDKQSFDETEGKWSDVNLLLKEICKNTIVLCAAGNSGPGKMAYPASLAGADYPRLIAVTACDAKGNPLTYAYHPDDSAQVAGRLISTLSTQGTRYDSEGVLLDPWAEVDPYLKRPAGGADFPAQRIISLDPRGPRGYNPSIYRYTPPVEGPHLEVGSLYAEFSGTSAATAIAAGLISLAIQSKGETDDSKVGADPLPGPGALFDINAALRHF